jgi:GntR family transcriptional regulator/MocR family aminotransferase
MRPLRGILLAGVDKASDTPLYLQLAARLRSAIDRGELPRDRRLPSTRTLAAELGVSRNTVAAAFDHLHAEGYLMSRVGDGTYVSRDLPRAPNIVPLPQQPAAERPVKLARRAAGFNGDNRGVLAPLFVASRPGVDLFPYDIWNGLVQRQLNGRRPEMLMPGDQAGEPSLRRAVASYLSLWRGLDCDADQVVITTGGLQSVDIATRLLCDAGDHAVLENPGCYDSRLSFAAASLVVHPVPVDGDGLDVAAAEAICPRPKLIHVTPSHQFPLSGVMPLQRRQALLAWARSHDAWVLEDEYDCDFPSLGHDIPALHRLDRDGRVIFVGTFTRSMFPGLTLGYAVVPRGLREAFGAAKRSIDGPAPAYIQAAMAAFIEEGHFAAHIRAMRRHYAARRAALLDGIRREVPELMPVGDVAAGLHVTLLGKPDLDDVRLSEACVAHGLSAPAVSLYSVGPARHRGLLLGYGPLGPQAIAASIGQLRAALGQLGGRGAPPPSVMADTGR